MTGEERASRRAVLLAALLLDNPRQGGACAMYADLLVEYQEGQENIMQHGSIVMHPRTGSPIQNPYIVIRDAAGAAMRRMQLEGLKTGAVWS